MYTIRSKRTCRCKSCLVNCQDTENLEGDSKDMKTRIIVTLMIVLSMCMVSTAALGDVFDDGYSEGCKNGYDDNESGLSFDVARDYEDPYDNETQNTEYEAGYKNGYYEGYHGGCLCNKPADKEGIENCMSSPALGLGLKLPDGTITQRGDQLPTLYTWAEVDDKYEHHTTLTFPAEGTYTGCVIITPPQIAGEPLVPSGFWDTPKGQRILQWKANAK